MCSEAMGDFFRFFLPALTVSVFLASCSTYRRLEHVRRNEVRADLAVPEVRDADAGGTYDAGNGPVREDPHLMNAVMDETTGEMVATDIIRASVVTARFRNVAERSGEVSIEFDVNVPSEMIASDWQLRLYPDMCLGNDTVSLAPVLVTGARYRSAQMRGYERYRAFISSLITDSTDFVMIKPLEMFLRRYFPQTYAMKNDTSFIPDPMAENIFGVRQKDALAHYTREGLRSRNEKRKALSARMLEKITGNIGGYVKLDTVIATPDGDWCYRYTHTFRSRPGLRRIPVSVSGGIYRNGERVYSVPASDDIVFYVSSLSSLADTSVRYVTEVLERRVSVRRAIQLDFDKGSSRVDTLLPGNAESLDEVRDWMRRMVSEDGMVADSIVITATCSPEGSYSYNTVLARKRAESVIDYMADYSDGRFAGIMRLGYIPENWDRLREMVVRDTCISEDSRKVILSQAEDDGYDHLEMQLQRLPDYEYLRTRLYPELRLVSFDLYMHRKGMQKDTVHTEVVDSSYMYGVKALKDMEYIKALRLLKDYRDYNSALAYLSSGYESASLKILEGLDREDPKVCYLFALALSMLERDDEAADFFRSSVMKDPAMLHRGRLDPEIYRVIRKYGLDDSDFQ